MGLVSGFYGNASQVSFVALILGKAEKLRSDEANINTPACNITEPHPEDGEKKIYDSRWKQLKAAFYASVGRYHKKRQP